MYFILAILIFGILIAVHELGHFMAAKACGVRVNEFAIGMGPAIYTKQKGETLYALRLLPIGGYCAMEGEDGGSNDPRSFENQGFIPKLIILVAGSAMNFLLGLVVIVIIFSQATAFVTTEITEFMEGCPYESAEGLQVGDVLYSVNGERTYFSSDFGTYVVRNGGSFEMDIEVIRDGERVSIEDFYMVPVEYEQDGEMVMKYGLIFGGSESGVSAMLKYSWYTCMDFVRMVRIGLTDLVTGGASVNDMSGVIGIVDMMNTVGESSETTALAVQNILYLGAFIAVNLAVMNLLPIPALDGGRVLFLTITTVIEKVTKHKVDSKYEAHINGAALMLLMALMVYVMFNDIARIIGG